LTEQLMSESKVNLDRQGKIFDIDYKRQQEEAEDYEKFGRPAQAAYYDAVSKYTAPERAEQEAQSALGDIRVAAAGQAAQQARKFGGLGIDPTSPAAIAAANDASVLNTATEAGAATRARRGAEDLGLKLKGDVANYARGALSNIVGLGTGAGAASSAGFAGTGTAAGLAPGGAANVNAGFGIAGKAYGENLDSATEIRKARMAQPSALAGIGQLAGTLGGAALGNPAIFGSDRRIKKAAKRIAILAHDIGLWAFRYIWEPDSAPLRYGYMADEVEPVFPDAVIAGPGGYKMVDYSKVAV
jgi:hypothetical protein